MSQNQPGQNVSPTPGPTGVVANSSTTAASSTSSSVILIPPNAPAGEILMTQPPSTAVSFYKIAPSQTVTFGWNLTEVLRNPVSLTVSALCENGNSYPVGPTDGVIPGTATQVFWDINAWQERNPQQPLPPGTCTLSIWDERGPSAAARPGFLKPFDQLQFALYTPQPYTALSDGWTCSQCHNAGVMSTVAHPALVGIATSFLVILLSGLHMLHLNPREL